MAGTRVMTDAVKAMPACSILISGRYRDKGHRDLSFKKAKGGSIRLQYSKKPRTKADSMPEEPDGMPI